MDDNSVVKFFCPAFFPSAHADTLRCYISNNESFSSCLLDILKSLILLIFKKKKAFLPRAAEEEFVFSGFLFPDEAS